MPLLARPAAVGSAVSFGVEREQPLLPGAIGAVGLLPAHVRAELQAVIAAENRERIGELQRVVHLHALVLGLIAPVLIRVG